LFAGADHHCKFARRLGSVPHTPKDAVLFYDQSNGSLLHIDLTADSPEQLKAIADTLQSLKFDEAE
jgi:hypothetical protein